MVVSEPIYVQLTWEDPETSELKRSLLAAPIAIGREIEQMPEYLGGQSVSRLELVHPEISRFHALIIVENNQLYVTDQASANGTFINGRRVKKNHQHFSSKDTLRIGSYKIRATLMRANDLNATAQNPDQANFSPSVQSLSQKTLVVWLIGGALLLLMGFAAWAVVSAVLEQSRPRVPIHSTPQSSIPGNREQGTGNREQGIGNRE